MTQAQTPPVVKWVANVLAALKGELQVMDRAIDDLHVRRAAIQAKADALSRVFTQVAPNIPLVHVPVVRAHVRFGGRGNLRTWLLKTLEAAYPHQLDTDALCRGAVIEFGMSFDSKTALDRFRKNSLGRALRKALEDGEVDRLTDKAAWSSGEPGIWRCGRRHPPWRNCAQPLTRGRADGAHHDTHADPDGVDQTGGDAGLGQRRA